MPIAPSAASTTTLDWNALRAKTERLPWAHDLLAGMDQRLKADLAVFSQDPPTEASDWAHHYYCDQCAQPLTFDPAKPKRHTCPECDLVYDDESKNGAWRKLWHSALLVRLEWAALLARLGTPEQAGPAVAFFRRQILFYADNYEQYAVHGTHAGKGKVHPQSLDEAVWLTALGRYLQWGRGQDWFSEPEMARLRNQLWAPAVELLRPQVSRIHNIHIWINSAIATAAYWLDDRELLDWTIDGEFGWRRQMELGVHADGFWWEGSPSYHYYSVAAFLDLALTAADAGRPLWDAPPLRRMLQAPTELAYADGSLPAFNDGWRTTLWRVLPLYELAAGIWPGEGFDAVVSHGQAFAPLGIHSWVADGGQSHDTTKPYHRGSTLALLYGLDELPAAEPKASASRHFAASGIAVLENANVRLCLRAGPHGGRHDHGDKLGYEVVAAKGWESRDLGTSGYGAAISNRWYRQPAAHNGLTVRQSRQETIDAEITAYRPDRVEARAVDAWPGITLRRTLTLTRHGWRDEMEVEAAEATALDWCFHGAGTLATDLALKPITSAGEGGGFDWLREVRSAQTDTSWHVTWSHGDVATRLTFAAEPGTEILLALGDDHPVGDSLGVVIVRRHAAQSRFVAEFEIGSKA